MLLLATILFTFVHAAEYIDTGYITWKQPNEVTFTARLWSDGFYWWMETQDGYRIIQGDGGYYYYAVLNENGEMAGEFAPSDQKVGIDSPLESSYQLERSSARNAAIEAEIEAFEQGLEIAYQNYLNKKASAPGGIITYKLGVILVDFTPSTRWVAPNNQYFPDGYEKVPFDSMFFSKNYWYDDEPGVFPHIHPDRHALFGSFVNYYSDQSQETVQFKGLNGTPSIVNPDTLVNGYLIPQWVILPRSKTYYADSISFRAYTDSVINAAISQFNLDTSQFNYYAIISAGTRQDPNLRGTANPHIGRYNVTEVSFHPYNPIYFAHIGGHAHEFAHLLGLHDYRDTTNVADLASWNWKLMGTPAQGPNNPNGACPCSFSPRARVEYFGWVEADTISRDTTLTITYDNENPEYYLIETSFNDEYFVLENRLREGFDLYTPNDVNLNYTVPDSIDPNGNAGGLLIWRNGEDLFVADNSVTPIRWPAPGDMENWAGDPFPFNQQDPGYGSGFNFNDNTTPTSNLSNGMHSYIAVNNITWNNSDSTVTASIFLSYGLEIITSDVTWSGLIELDRDILVTDSATLTITAGTVVAVDTTRGIDKIEIRFESGSSMEALGTESLPIVLKSAYNASNSDWQGLSFESGSDFEFTHVAVKNAVRGLDVLAMDSVEISNRHFEGLSFENCHLAIAGLNGNNFSFNNCHFINSQLSVSAPHSEFDLCTIDSSSLALSFAENSSVIKNSTFLHSASLNINAADVNIKHNQFLSGSGIRINGAGTPTIQHNVMNGQGRPTKGIFMSGDESIEPLIVNNTISFYEFGIYCWEDPETGYAVPAIRNNILYKNSYTIDENGNMSGGGADAAVTYTCIYNLDNTGAPFDSTNLYEDPIFVNDIAGDFHLKANSPCIDAGSPADSFQNEPYPNGNRINMGAYGNTAEATLSFNVIAQNDLVANTTWSGYVNVMEDISTNGYALTVQPGTKVLFDDGKVLTVSGDFICEGIQGGEPDTIIFRGYRPTERMGGVAVDYGDLQHELRLRYAAFRQGETGLFLQNVSTPENPFEHLEFSGNSTGLYANESAVEISASNFFDNETGLTARGADLTLVECEFDSNSTEGLYLLDSQFRIADCAFRDNGLRGVYFEYSSEGGFYENIVTGNSYSAVNTQAKGGLVFYQSSPTVSGNRVTENKAPGMVSFASSYPLMVEPGYNLVAQNAREGSENPPEIQVYDISFPILDYGFNDIMDSVGGYLMHREGDEREIIVYVRENYWGTTDSLEIASRLYPPDSYHFSPFSRSWNTGGLGFAKGTGQGGNVLAEALQAERDSHYAAAMILYDSLAHASPLLAESKAALERLYYLKLKAGEPVANVKACFDNLSSHPDTALATVAKRLAIRCLTYAEDYQAAITEHAAWAQATPYFCDSVYSEIDILTNELFAGGGWFGKATGLNGAGGKAAGSGRPGSNGGITSAQYLKAQQVQLAQCRQETERLLNLLLEPGTRQTSLLIPQEFALLQNYPNPFNPTTTIEYHLPLDSQVKIEIYNILGQRVKILVDQREKAGKYKIVWDGRNESGNRAASGMYVYRIQATSGGKTFVKARKMIVLK